MERGVERVEQNLRGKQRPDSKCRRGSTHASQRRRQEQEQRIETEEIAVANRPTAARIGERSQHDQHQRGSDNGGGREPLPRLALPREEQHGAEKAREKIRKQTAESPDEKIDHVAGE